MYSEYHCDSSVVNPSIRRWLLRLNLRGNEARDRHEEFCHGATVQLGVGLLESSGSFEFEARNSSVSDLERTVLTVGANRLMRGSALIRHLMSRIVQFFGSIFDGASEDDDSLRSTMIEEFLDIENPL